MCVAVTIECGATCARQQARILEKKGWGSVSNRGQMITYNKAILSIITPNEPHMAEKPWGNLFI